ncbi:MAG: phospholipid carrier-dependent glycosyltransferase [Deltaproteobacteria bacterium]|nr:phospholipid carrier-dependent glycosyltransferase [Deltaproteobacteria bacterium]
MTQGYLKNRTSKIVIAVVVVVVGVMICFSSVKKDRDLLTVDEAAWIFDSGYLHLYLSGDWDNAEWHSLDKYAKHPPFGGYLFGTLMKLIGEPIDGLEPAHFWNENDISKLRYPENFFRGINERFSYRQLIAGRYLSISFGVLAALMTMLLAYRLVGYWGAIFGYVILIINPIFRHIASMATPDLFLIFLSLLAVYISVEISNRPRIDKKSWLMAILLSSVLGVAFATKISAYAIAAMIFIPMFFLSKKGTLSRKFLLGVAMVFAGILIAYILDPNLHGDPLGAVFNRMVWRLNRLDIQQLTSPSLALLTVADRLHHDLYTIFLINTEAFVLFIFTVIGMVGIIYKIVDARKSYVVLFLAIFSLILTLALTPLALLRYVFAYIPFLVLLASVGGETVSTVISKFGGMNSTSKVKVCGFAVAILMCAMMVRYLTPKYIVNNAPQIDERSWNLISDYEKSIMYPREDMELHMKLYEYFKGAGDVKRADRQKRYLEN